MLLSLKKSTKIDGYKNSWFDSSGFLNKFQNFNHLKIV